MRFETTADIERERKAIKAFVRIFKGSFEKLGDNDIDYKIFNEAGELIGYTEIKGRHCNMNKAFPLPVAARKLVKLSDKLTSNSTSRLSTSSIIKTSFLSPLFLQLPF